MNKYLLYANYYYNFEFNVTCIGSERTEHTTSGSDILKSPNHGWKSYTKYRQSLATLRSYPWENAKGIGVVLGYNNLRALDIDGCDKIGIIRVFLIMLALPLEYEWVVKSGSENGFHILFYADQHKFEVAENKIKAFKSNTLIKNGFKHIELRWVGHLVLPPSLHKSFNNYSFVHKSIPHQAPLTIDNEKLYELLVTYCIGDSLSPSSNLDERKRLNENESKPSTRWLGAMGDGIAETWEEYLISSAALNDALKHDDSRNDEYISGTYLDEDVVSSEPIDASYYLFFDTETTGVPKDWNAPTHEFEKWPRLVQLAWLLFDAEGELISNGECIIKPEGYTIPIEASNVHGITTEQAILNGIAITDALAEFREQCLKSKFVVGHNVSFDARVMEAEYIRNSVLNPFPDVEQICTMTSTTDFCKINGPYGYKWPRLSELHVKLFESDFSGAHNALADVEATARCFWKLREMEIL